MVMICEFHSTDHACFCLTGSTTRIQNHCKVSKVSPFFKRLIGKFISTKNSRSIHLVIFHYVPHTLHIKEKRCWKIVVVVFLIYDKNFFKCLVYRPFSTKYNSRMTNFKATKIFILIDPLRMPEQKEKKEGKE